MFGLAAAIAFAGPASGGPLDDPIPTGKKPAESRAKTGSELAELSLIAESTSLVAGETTWIAARFVMDDGWHLYWRNPGSSGFPPTFSFEAPEGVAIGDPVWPVPERYKAPSGAVDYVYHGELMVLFPVRTSGDLAGETITIGLSCDWLICETLCLAGSGEASLEVAVAASAEPSRHASRFDGVRRRLPAPVCRTVPIEASWEGDTLTIRSEGAASLAFLPYETEAFVEPVGMWDRGAVPGDTLAIEWRGDLHEVGAMRGVLVIGDGSGNELFHVIEVPR